jgi:hypothetical protein
MASLGKSSTSRLSALDYDLLATFRADKLVRRALPGDYNLLGLDDDFGSYDLHCFPLLSAPETLTGSCEAGSSPPPSLRRFCFRSWSAR